jgi:hypothetical protein
MKKRFFIACLFFLSIPVLFPIVTGALTEETSLPASEKSSANPGQEKELGGQWSYYGDLVGRINPRGLGFFGGFQYRNIYGYNEKYDVVSSYWQTGLGVGLSPATLQVGLHFEWMPWMFLPLRFKYDFYGFSGSNGALLSFNDSKSPYGDEVRDKRHDEEKGSAHRFLFQPTLQGKINRLIIRNQTDVAFFRFSGKGPYFLEIGEDTLLKDGDFLVANRTQFLYSFFSDRKGKKLLLGPYYEITRAIESEITQQKIGLALYWEPALTIRYLGKPHLGVMTAYHLEDPSRQGQLYLLMALGFEYTFPAKSP